MASALPRDVTPMLATAGSLPDKDEGWAYEIKFDGVRVLTFVEKGEARLVTRNGNDVTSSYPELADIAAALDGHSAILDGEVVVFDPQGRTDFSLLQSRMHVRAPSEALRRSAPVRLLVFDLLHLDGESLMPRSYDERRAALLDLGLRAAAWDTPRAVEGDGPTIAEASREQGLEGIMAKLRSAPYLPGRRVTTWLKVKNIRRTSAVVVGWRPGEGNREGHLGSLLLGVHGETGFEYAGQVGTGFTAATLRQLEALLEPLTADASPLDQAVPRAQARNARWVRPELVAEVDYTEWTRDGRMRHPSFKGLRDDYDPADVVRD
ncbi:MAG TPA: non-homologous end-joining DNA ligase [Lapillicoccus sp.]|jgi:bifunctional non-homologous end joining protein LigD|uniref:non-homologous end-joining DNA ligase n=1 Tax=Lapillicoccus sp. TaxID=1909287 RepID=UPI002F91C7F0